MKKPLDVTVRYRVRRRFNEWDNEWTATRSSWQAAWRVVDDCAADREGCRRINTNADRAQAVVDHWMLDVNGREEHADYRAWFFATTSEDCDSETASVQDEYFLLASTSEFIIGHRGNDAVFLAIRVAVTDPNDCVVLDLMQRPANVRQCVELLDFVRRANVGARAEK